MIKTELLEKIANRTLKVAVVGLGYVGLPLAVEKAGAGFRTVGFDIQSSKVDAVNRGENYIGDIVNERLRELVDNGMLSATSDFSFVRDADFIAICVPTPIDEHEEPDISYVENSAREIAQYLTAGTVVVLESTTYPGTTEELLRPILETSGLICGEDFYLGFSPERVDPGNLIYKTKNTPKVVGAIGADAAEVIAAVYRAVLDSEIHIVSSPAVAEMEKILENTYRNVNIALVNEFAMLCHKMNIDIWEVIDAAKTKPYGFQAFYPGPGAGGHCIPVDPNYLTWKAKEYQFHTAMIETAMSINDNMPEYVVGRVMEILNQERKALNGSSVLVLGVSYKANSDDYRESPALPIIEYLQNRGADVEYYDPLIPEYKYRNRICRGLDRFPAEKLGSYDLVVLLSDNREFNHAAIARSARRIFDTRNAFAEIGERDHIELL